MQHAYRIDCKGSDVRHKKMAINNIYCQLFGGQKKFSPNTQLWDTALTSDLESKGLKVECPGYGRIRTDKWDLLGPLHIYFMNKWNRLKFVVLLDGENLHDKIH